MVQRVGYGPRDWAPHELELLKAGKKVPGYVGDHITSVVADITKAADHRNIQFLTKAGHDARHAAHGGTQVPISEDRLIDRTLDGKLPDLATEGAKSWAARGRRGLEGHHRKPHLCGNRHDGSGDLGRQRLPPAAWIQFLGFLGRPMCGRPELYLGREWMKSIRDVLQLDRWPDLVVGPNGYAAKRRPDIAPFAYELVINNPLRAETLEKVVNYAGKADRELTRRLFSLCNGIRIGATKLAVYGVLAQIDRGWRDVAQHPPLDINVPNIYERPTGWPEDYLIVGSSTEDGGKKKMFHAISSDARIVIAAKESASSVVREYDTVERWLASEVDRAIKDETRF